MMRCFSVIYRILTILEYVIHCYMLQGERIMNRQRLLTFYCLQPFNLTLRPGLIMSETSDDSLLAQGDP